jgi:hypothetical protein
MTQATFQSVTTRVAQLDWQDLALRLDERGIIFHDAR